MTKVKLGDVAIEYKQAYQGNRESVPNVGLEHLIPSEVKLSCWNTDNDNTFTKRFNKGQVLLGRRRAYLKKAVVAPFDGICSSDITVIEAVPNKISPELLPFIIQNERFFNYAIKGSAGSLSPRVKWEYLKEYEFDLPPIEEQERLAELLWAAYDLKESYKKLIAATDEMVKAQFTEMFGNIENKILKDVVLRSGEYGSNTPATNYNGEVRYIRITDITNDGALNNDMVSPTIMDEKFLLNTNDMVFARTGNTVGKTYLHKDGKMIFAGYLIRYKFNKKLMLPEFAISYTHTSTYYDWVNNTKKIGAQPNISAVQYDNMPIPVPPIKDQTLFVSIANQADKSKAELQQSIEHIDKVMRSLLP